MSDEIELSLGADVGPITIPEGSGDVKVILKVRATDSNIHTLSNIDRTRGVRLTGYQQPPPTEDPQLDLEKIICVQCEASILPENAHYDEETGTQLCYDCLPTSQDGEDEVI